MGFSTSTAYGIPFVILVFFFSSAATGALSSSSLPAAAPPSLTSSFDAPSSSLSGAPNALAGFAPAATLCCPEAAAKLESLGPDPPANPLLSFEPNTLPVPRPPKPELVLPPNENPLAGLPLKAPNPLGAVDVVVELEEAAASAPNPDGAADALPPNTLGVVELILPNGDEPVARDAKPELANAEADVCGFSFDIVGEGEFRDAAFSASALSSLIFAVLVVSICSKERLAKVSDRDVNDKGSSDLDLSFLLCRSRVLGCVSRPPFLLWL